jgi:ribonuclease-3
MYALPHRLLSLLEQPPECEGMAERLAPLEAVIGYTFRRRELLRVALTHRTYAHERRDGWDSYGVLEFVGDAVLDLLIAQRLWLDFPDADEGVLTRLRTAVVSEAPLARCAAGIELGTYLYLGRGAELQGMRTRPSVLSDAFEAVIAAIFLDAQHAGRDAYAAAWQVVERVMGAQIDAVGIDDGVDAKSQLQWRVQEMHKSSPRYEVTERSAASEQCGSLAPIFDAVAWVEIDGARAELGRGRGDSRQKAETAAAAAALVGLRK